MLIATFYERFSVIMHFIIMSKFFLSGVMCPVSFLRDAAALLSKINAGLIP